MHLNENLQNTEINAEIINYIFINTNAKIYKRRVYLK